MSLIKDEVVTREVAAKVDVEFPKTLQGEINATVDPAISAVINADIASSKGVPQELLDHLTDYNNPHRITPESIGSLKEQDIKNLIKTEIDTKIFNTAYELPSIGQSNHFYIISNEDEDSIYIWDDNNGGFRCVGSNYKNIGVIDGGNANGK